MTTTEVGTVRCHEECPPSEGEAENRREYMLRDANQLWDKIQTLKHDIVQIEHQTEMLLMFWLGLQTRNDHENKSELVFRTYKKFEWIKFVKFFIFISNSPKLSDADKALVYSQVYNITALAQIILKNSQIMQLDTLRSEIVQSELSRISNLREYRDEYYKLENDIITQIHKSNFYRRILSENIVFPPDYYLNPIKFQYLTLYNMNNLGFKHLSIDIKEACSTSLIQILGRLMGYQKMGEIDLFDANDSDKPLEEASWTDIISRFTTNKMYISSKLIREEIMDKIIKDIRQLISKGQRFVIETITETIQKSFPGKFTYLYEGNDEILLRPDPDFKVNSDFLSKFKEALPDFFRSWLLQYLHIKLYTLEEVKIGKKKSAYRRVFDSGSFDYKLVGPNDRVHLPGQYLI